MAAEQEFDDLLRKKLGGVKPPAPPTMDWSAMARAAKGGASAVPSTGSSLPLWKVLIGAAAVGGVGWFGYSALSTGTAVEKMVVAETPVTTAEHSPVAGVPSPRIAAEEPSEVVASIREEGTLPTPSKVERHLAADGMSVAPTKFANAQRRTPVSTTRDDVVDQRMTSHIAEWPYGPSAVSMPVDPASDEHTGSDRTSADRVASIPNKEAATVLMDRSANGVQASSDAPFPMEGLVPAAAPLPLVPNAPTTEPPTTNAFPRFAVSPWVSVARSMPSEAPEQLAEQVDQLGGLGEWVGTAGVRVEYALIPRAVLISGLQYTNKGRLQGTIESSPEVSTDYAVSGAYWEVPISLRYEFPQAGKSFYARSGVLLQFNARAGSDKVVMHDQGLKEMSTLALSSSSMGVALDLGAGVRFRLGRGIGLFVEPSYQYCLSPVVKIATFDRLPYNPRIHSFGLGTGLTFQIGSR